MSTLDFVLTTEPTSDRTFRLGIPEGWEQGRSTFGGLVVGGMVRTMSSALEDKTRSLRSLNAELVGSVGEGEAHLNLRTLREGNAVTALAVELVQGGQLMAHAVGIFGQARAFRETWRDLTQPVRRPWREADVAEMDAAFAPRFTKHFEYRPILGAPFGGGAPSTEGWVRPRAIAEIRDAAYIAALADAWWLAAMAKLTAPRPASTLCFSLDLHSPIDTLASDAPLYHRGYVSALSDGYATEVRELWGEDGRLVCINRQLVVIIK